METDQPTGTKEKARNYMHRRAASHTPPPSIEQTRRELGWVLIREAAKQNKN